jgi:anthranilate synthase component 2|tara:strand:- start:269 stop:847 length:579 start_codon:yes stop_codon:yes gene_type:complete
MLLLLDNYDSFTWNVYHFLKSFKVKVQVVRNNKLKASDNYKFEKYKGIVFSPGPGKPENAGEMMNIISNYKDKIPMLGICLGHQAIGASFGAKIVKMKKVMHGKTDNITILKNSNIIKNIPNNFIATRYHSLEISNKNLPKEIEVLAENKEKSIMAIKVKNKKIYGLQFHPESIATSNGELFFKNFIKICYK